MGPKVARSATLTFALSYLFVSAFCHIIYDNRSDEIDSGTEYVNCDILVEGGTKQRLTGRARSEKL